MVPPVGVIQWERSWVWEVWRRYVTWRDRLPEDAQERLQEWDRQFSQCKQAMSELVTRH